MFIILQFDAFDKSRSMFSSAFLIQERQTWVVDVGVTVTTKGNVLFGMEHELWIPEFIDSAI